jgi:NCS1 nucleoside transporter family
MGTPDGRIAPALAQSHWARTLTIPCRQSIIICIFGSILGGAVSGFCATLGAPTGLRQISISRYSFGWWPTKLIALLNTIGQIGWSSAGCITGGIALNAVADGKVSIALGIVIIAVASLAVSFFGIKAILPFERYAWFVYLIVFLIILGQTGPSADNTTETKLEGADLAGNVLSLLAIVYGSSASWCTVASDYYVLYPPSTSRTKVFLLTTLGVAIPTSFGMVSGCVVSSALNNEPTWNDAYNNNGGSGLGFLVQTALHPSGFAKFLLVLLVLSAINCNIINTYSAALSCQQFARPFAKIPRVLWTVACFAVILAIALAGRDHLLDYLENFLSLLGYWCTSYFVIVASEHFVFRKADVVNNYDLEAWNDPARLPLGLAAIASFLLGVVMWCMGMVETWFVGPIGGLIGADGGDVANELTFAVTLLAYLPLRWVELRYVGR